MSRTTHWNPLQEIDAFSRQVNRLFGGTPFRMPNHPAVNVSVGDDNVVLTAELPGFDPERFDISIVRNTVTLKGERASHELGEGETWVRRERSVDSFERTVKLPFEVDAESADASYEHGVLRLVLNRPEEHKPRKISVRAN